MSEENLTGEQPQNLEGSPYGKFNSVEDLKSAYDSLEKEFTRKSQLLKNFEKQAENFDGNNFENSTNEDIMSQDKIQVENGETPYWERDDWNSQVEDFLNENPLAKSHAKEISKMVIEDKSLLSSKRPLYSAWAKWLEANYKTPEQLLDNQEFLSQIQKNEKVRRAIIKDYLAEINGRETTPPLFASSDGAGESRKNSSPQTLDEVKELAKKIFSK